MSKQSQCVFPYLLAKMALHGDNLKTLSRKLGIGYQALSARLKGKKSFELPEIYLVLKLYDCNFEDVFIKSTTQPDKSA